MKFSVVAASLITTVAAAPAGPLALTNDVAAPALHPALDSDVKSMDMNMNNRGEEEGSMDTSQLEALLAKLGSSPQMERSVDTSQLEQLLAMLNGSAQRGQASDAMSMDKRVRRQLDPNEYDNQLSALLRTGIGGADESELNRRRAEEKMTKEQEAAMAVMDDMIRNQAGRQAAEKPTEEQENAAAVLKDMVSKQHMRRRDMDEEDDLDDEAQGNMGSDMMGRRQVGSGLLRPTPSVSTLPRPTPSALTVPRPTPTGQGSNPTPTPKPAAAQGQGQVPPKPAGQGTSSVPKPAGVGQGLSQALAQLLGLGKGGKQPFQSSKVATAAGDSE